MRENYKPVTVRINPHLVEAAKNYAAEHQTTLAAIIRAGIETIVDKSPDKLTRAQKQRLELYS